MTRIAWANNGASFCRSFHSREEALKFYARLAADAGVKSLRMWEEN